MEDVRHVEGFVEGADVRGSISEHAEDYVLFLAISHRPASADRKRQVAADDPGAAHEAELRVEHVHRSTATVGCAGLLAEELGHHGPEVDYAPDRLPMLAVAREVVVPPLGAADATNG